MLYGMKVAIRKWLTASSMASSQATTISKAARIRTFALSRLQQLTRVSSGVGDTLQGSAQYKDFPSGAMLQI